MFLKKISEIQLLTLKELYIGGVTAEHIQVGNKVEEDIET